MVAAIVACMVQGFFAWRLQIVAQQAWLTTFIIICSACTLLGGIGTGIAVLWVKSYALFGTFKPIASIWLISATIADITITLALTYHLRRRRGSFGATDRLLDRIVQRELRVSCFIRTILMIYSDHSEWFSNSSCLCSRYLPLSFDGMWSPSSLLLRQYLTCSSA